ncbi:MAG: phosphotransferase, partial [Proteobacteria bacterium]|nr:phosphotransferase [Pseudomonadota bacterium]
EEEISGYLNLIEKNWNDDLDGGTVHTDLFPDNVFFDENDNLSGIIDFYFAANDLFIYDFAVIVNAWCFDADNQFNKDKFDAAFNGYNQVRKFTKDELEFLDIALIAAATRFLLTRLYDLFNTPEGSLVKVKDPQEYAQKVHFFFDRLQKRDDLLLAKK